MSMRTIPFPLFGLSIAKDIARICELFNGFNPNLNFTVDTFENEIPHFLDIEIADDGLTIYHKNTHMDFTSYTKWSHKIAWIRSLVNRAKSICSPNYFKSSQLSLIRRFISWNGFPKHIGESILQKTPHPSHDRPAPLPPAVASNNKTLIYLQLPYLGKKGEQLVANCIC